MDHLDTSVPLAMGERGSQYLVYFKAKKKQSPDKNAHFCGVSITLHSFSLTWKLRNKRVQLSKLKVSSEIHWNLYKRQQTDLVLFLVLHILLPNLNFKILFRRKAAMKSLVPETETNA